MTSYKATHPDFGKYSIFPIQFCSKKRERPKLIKSKRDTLIEFQLSARKVKHLSCQTLIKPNIWCLMIFLPIISTISLERESSYQRLALFTSLSMEDIYSREVSFYLYFLCFLDTLMSDVYNQRKDADGFLYITYTDETTLG